MKIDEIRDLGVDETEAPCETPPVACDTTSFAAPPNSHRQIGLPSGTPARGSVTMRALMSAPA